MARKSKLNNPPKDKKTKMTKHFQEERLHRAVFIGTTIGFGDVVHEHMVFDEQRGYRLHCVTNTGVDIIKDPASKAVITAYIMTVSQLKKLFDNERDIPLSLLSTVKRNEKQRLHEKSEQYRAE